MFTKTKINSYSIENHQIVCDSEEHTFFYRQCNVRLLYTCNHSWNENQPNRIVIVDYWTSKIHLATECLNCCSRKTRSLSSSFSNNHSKYFCCFHFHFERYIVLKITWKNTEMTFKSSTTWRYIFYALIFIT